MDDKTVVVVLTSNSDEATDLRLLLVEAVLSGASSIVVDASGVDQIPSSTITAMLTAHRACRRRGGQLLIRDPSRRALNQISRTGLRDVLAVEAPRPTDIRGSA